MAKTKSRTNNLSKRVAAKLKPLGTAKASPKSSHDFQELLDRLHESGALGDESKALLSTAARVISSGITVGGAASLLGEHGLLKQLLQADWAPVAEVLYDRIVECIQDGGFDTERLLRAAPTSKSVGRLARVFEGGEGAILDQLAANTETWFGSPAAEWAMERKRVDARLALVGLALDRVSAHVDATTAARLIATALRSARTPDAVVAQIWLRAAESENAATAVWRLVLNDDELASSGPAMVMRAALASTSGIKLLPAIAHLAKDPFGDLPRIQRRADLALAKMRLYLLEQEAIAAKRVSASVTDFVSRLQTDRAKEALQSEAADKHSRAFVLSLEDVRTLASAGGSGRLSVPEAKWVIDAMDSVHRGEVARDVLVAMAKNLGMRPTGEPGEEVVFDPLRHVGDGRALPGDRVRVCQPGWRVASGMIVQRPRVESIA